MLNREGMIVTSSDDIKKGFNGTLQTCSKKQTNELQEYKEEREIICTERIKLASKNINQIGQQKV